LVKLCLTYHSNITDECIIHLPRQLRVLRLKSNVPHLISSAGIPHFPPALRKLILNADDYEFNGFGFSHLRGGKYERQFVGHV